MRQALRHPQHPVIVGGQLHAPPCAKGSASCGADPPRRQKRCLPSRAPACLGYARSENAGRASVQRDGAAMVVLNECRVDSGGSEFLRLPGLQEKSARVAEYLRLDQHHILNGCLLKFHDSDASLLRALFDDPQQILAIAAFRQSGFGQLRRAARHLMNPARQAISSTQAILSPCRSSMMRTNTPASSSELCVPVSSHAVPRPKPLHMQIAVASDRRDSDP